MHGKTRIKYLGKKTVAATGEYFTLKDFPRYEVSNDTAATGYDWLVVYDEMPVKGLTETFHHGVERLECPKSRTILVTHEPESVKDYGRAYVLQFGHYLTTRRRQSENHPHYHLGRGYFHWYYGKSKETVESEILPEKKKLISAVCSAKRMKHTRHDDRYRLIKHLSGAVSGFDWFGRGIKDISFKYEALDGYKYHVAVENHISPGHCTEKLIDSILGECLTFYAGDPDVGKWLPPESFIQIPLNDPVAAEKIILAAIESDEYSRRRPAVLAAKRLILEKYNLWAQIVEIIEAEERKCPGGETGCQRGEVVKSRRRLRRNPVVAVIDGWRHLMQIARGYLNLG